MLSKISFYSPHIILRLVGVFSDNVITGILVLLMLPTISCYRPFIVLLLPGIFSDNVTDILKLSVMAILLFRDTMHNAVVITLCLAIFCTFAVIP